MNVEINQAFEFNPFTSFENPGTQNFSLWYPQRRAPSLAGK